MSAPKPELTPELRAVMEKMVEIFPAWTRPTIKIHAEALVREVVEIVARRDAELVINVDRHNKYRSCADDAILSSWGLK